MVAGGRARPYAAPRGPPTSRGSWPSASPVSGPAPSRSTRRVGRSDRACCGATPAGRRTRERPSAGRSPATRRSRWPRGCVAAVGSRRSSGDDPVGHILFLQHEQPDVVARARWLLEPVDYLTMRFTGVPAASHASMTGAWLTDNRSLATLAYDDVLVRATGVDASRLPPLVATGSVVGTCRRRWPRTSASLRPPSPSPACPTCTRPPSVRARSGWGSRTRRSARRPGSARRCPARRATCCGCRPRSRAWTTRRTSSPTTRSPPAATCSGGATRSRPSSATTTCWPRRPPRLRGPAAWCSRPG